ncbi:MAG TPA: SDR family oxidoreductase [Candidatus Polarisedimenticolia bacterium]|nr:SDR family oxidoreductase [Candidatus Polarisedimenticolia bacterium]
MSLNLLLVLVIYAVGLTAALAFGGHRSGSIAPATGSRNRPERILIIGATGRTGRHLVTQALARGFAVTAFARDPSSLEMRHPRLTIAQGNVLDPASIEAAMPGHDAVVSALGHKRYFSLSRTHAEGTRHILEAMRRHHVRRFVCLTSLGLGDSAGRLGMPYNLFVIPLLLPIYFLDKARQERLIAKSDVDWIIVRPGSLNNRAKRERVNSGAKVGSYLWTVRVSRANVADFVLNQLSSDAYLRSAPGLAW